MKYDDLRSGGRALAAALGSYRSAKCTLVLGIVRGGVPPAWEVAHALDLPLDFVLLRALLQREARHVRAANVAGTLVLDDELMTHDRPLRSVEEIFVAEGIEALAERARTCRGARPALDLAGKTILLVDNGMRTGTTMRAAVGAVRRLGPARIVAAAPVASREALSLSQALADEVVCLARPEPFGNVAMFYTRFDVPADGQIPRFLR